MKTTLHHFAYDITPNNLEFVVELFEKLGCGVKFQEAGARWCMIGQVGIPISMQIIETLETPLDAIEKKINTHISFLSDNPKGDIDELEKWCKERDVKFRRGSWSDRELWFDLPEIFVNFVVEIMHTSIVK